MMEKDIKKAVREGYARIAEQGGSCCCGPSSSCCGTNSAAQISRGIGYSDDDLTAVPDGANLGLGCGNPVALAALKEGEVVLDLGSGAGFDCFLAADKVGEKGSVIGVDMTPEMVARARENARKGDYNNVEFRLGEIENLPVADSSVDVVISNCVINLSPDKKKVFKEVFRVLKPGGRLMVSDIVLLKPIPSVVLDSIEMYVSCIAGASSKSDYLQAIEAAGFEAVEVMEQSTFPIDFINDPTVSAIKENLNISPEQFDGLSSSVVSIKICAEKHHKEI
ncbi:MAG: arsenite methyltransferase [Candidatus Omnitrophica bacterium]|nr:arsenite methyltransferase [Candidatus Omnitrophota bacterium]